MIDSMPDRITAENSERICELEQQSFSEAQSSRSSQNNRVSERSDSMEFDSAGINQTACENNSHQVDINHKSPFVSTPPLSFSPGRSFSITERNVQTVRILFYSMSQKSLPCLTWCVIRSPDRC